MTLYGEDDLSHAPGDHPKWQESWVLIFRDPATNLVGFLRLGAYVNERLAQTHFGLALPDGTRFRRHRLDLPFVTGAFDGDVMRAGPLSYSIPGGAYVRFQGEEAEASFDLRLYDYYPSQPWKLTGDLERLAKNHLESSGRVEGTVRIGDRVIEIKNGFGHRDHSWGPREHAAILNNRWMCGTCGPALSFSTITAQQNGGVFTKAAFVVRHGKVEHAKDVNTAAIVLADGVSTIGGWTDITLESGERLRIEAEVIDGIITSSHLPNGGPGSTPAGVEALSIARCGDLEGFCDLNLNINPLNGESPVTRLLLANSAEGLTQRDPEEVRWAYDRRR